MKTKINLKYKILLILIVNIGILQICSFFIIKHNYSKSIKNELLEKGKYIGHAIAVKSINLLLTDNIIELKNLINLEQLHHQNIVYILLNTYNNQPIVNTFKYGLPQELLNANPITNNQDYNFKYLQMNNKHIYDFAVPIRINDSIVGIVRIGISDENIITLTKKLLTTFFFSGFLMAILNFFLAIKLTSLILKPLKKLSIATNEISNGNFDHIIKIQSGDEIEDLAKDFNFMTQKLNENINKLKNEISGRIKILEEREFLIGELEAKQKDLEKFLYITTHDLKSPLVNIQGFTYELSNALKELEALLSDLSVDTKKSAKIKTLVKEDIEISRHYILNNVKKMQVLLDGLKKVFYFGKVNLNPVTIHLPSMIKSILQSMQYEINKNNIEVLVGNLTDCYGDKAQINQAFSNIINNSLKYRSSERPTKINISSSINENWVIYCISDNGIGIDPKHKNKIFDIFYRLNPQSSVEGEGLGLHIVKTVIDRNKGETWVESELNVGSKVYVKLPAAK